MENWKKLLLNNIYPLLLVGTVLLFFYPTFLSRRIPIPADTIVGMYHPWRDEIWSNFTQGVPYKNFLITDPVRQQYVWRKMGVEELKKGNLPVWNPYSFSGTPLLANFQSASFYPLNLLYLVLPFNFVWTLQVILQPILASVFLYLYLRNIKVSKIGSFLGGFTFAFCGFSIAWLEWNTIIQTVLWLPLILLAKEKLLSKLTVKWSVILFFAEISSFLAGHIQVLFYTLIVSNSYLFVRIIQLSFRNRKGKNILEVAGKKYIPFLFIGLVVLLITSVQWVPTFQFIIHSARDFDQSSWMKEGWFIPWQNAIQFIAPDFFGNPATGNYWGIWNYGEFIGFIGSAPLILAIYSLIFKKDRKVLFFGSLAFLGAIFSFPTLLAKLPFILKIPLLSTSQPTRLMVIIDFALCILAAIGFDQFVKDKKSQKIIFLLGVFAVLLFSLWIVVLKSSVFHLQISFENLKVMKNNLIIPTAFMVLNAIILIFIAKAKNNFKKVSEILFLIVVVLELFRFGWKFTPFSNEKWMFPETKAISYLRQNANYYRVMSIDRRLMPPNFSISYGLNDVSGYDPLYLLNYGQLVAAWERGKPDITQASFNRIVTPSKSENFITDLLGVKFILSMNPLMSPKLSFILHEGNTYIYENKSVFPKVFLTEDIVSVDNPQEMITKMFELGDNLRHIAVLSDKIEHTYQKLSEGETANITSYLSNKVEIEVKSNSPRFLILTDIYSPSWKVFIDGREEKLYQVDFALRGVLVPSGNHNVEFKANLI